MQDTKRPQGEWVLVGKTESRSNIIKCTNCGRIRRGRPYSPFCPDCGAEMTKAKCNEPEEQCVEEVIADKIIADGWTKPICSVGDTLWVVYKNKVYPVTIYAVRTDNKKNNKRICVEGNFHICEPYGNYTHYYSSTFNISNIGKSIFNTEEEALKSTGGNSK